MAQPQAQQLQVPDISSKDRKASGLKLKHIGKYTLLEELGKGSFATVKKAVDRGTGQGYAVKIVEKKKIMGEGLELQLKREVMIMLNLKHENIVRMYEVLQSENNVYLVIELVTGGDLFDAIKASKRLDERTARHYFQQLIVGIHACHVNGIAHRDLKPENCLISADGVLKIADFGLANLQKGDQYLKTVCGTPNYVAPEVLKQTNYDGFKSDLWSVGVMLFVMLSGRLPFYQKPLPELIAKIKAAEYKMPECVTPDQADLITKLLTIDPNVRYTVFDVAKHPWFRFDGWLDSRLDITPVKDDESESVGKVGEDSSESVCLVPIEGAAANLASSTRSNKKPSPLSLQDGIGSPGLTSPGESNTPTVNTPGKQGCLIPPVNSALRTPTSADRPISPSAQKATAGNGNGGTPHHLSPHMPSLPSRNGARTPTSPSAAMASTTPRTPSTPVSLPKTKE